MQTKHSNRYKDYVEKAKGAGAIKFKKRGISLKPSKNIRTVLHVNEIGGLRGKPIKAELGSSRQYKFTRFGIVRRAQSFSLKSRNFSIFKLMKETKLKELKSNLFLPSLSNDTSKRIPLVKDMIWTGTTNKVNQVEKDRRYSNITPELVPLSPCDAINTNFEFKVFNSNPYLPLPSNISATQRQNIVTNSVLEVRSSFLNEFGNEASTPIRLSLNDSFQFS